MTRSVEPWVGKTDDERIPPRVRARVFLAHEGKCWLSGRKIRPGEKWELDHKIALVLGGAHAEHNLAPALASEHRKKTADDTKAKSKVARVRAKFLGVFPKSPWKLRGRGFQRRAET